MKIPQELVTVTPFSKGLALSLFIVLPFIAFIGGIKVGQERQYVTDLSTFSQPTIQPYIPPTPKTHLASPEATLVPTKTLMR